MQILSSSALIRKRRVLNMIKWGSSTNIPTARAAKGNLPDQRALHLPDFSCTGDKHNSGVAQDGLCDSSGSETKVCNWSWEGSPGGHKGHHTQPCLIPIGIVGSCLHSTKHVSLSTWGSMSVAKKHRLTHVPIWIVRIGSIMLKSIINQN